MGYKVKGAAAVVELDDGNEDIGSGRRVYLEQGAAVPSDAKKAHVEHLLEVGIIEKSATAARTSSDDSAPASAKSGGKSEAGA